MLAVPPALHPVDAARPFKTILCAVDFSAPSVSAMVYAASLARESSARLTMVHIVEWPFGAAHDGALPAEIAELERRLEAEGRRELHDAIVRADLAGAAPAEVVVVGKPWREIVRLAREGAADLIVMGVQGRGAIDLALLGSTTHHVIRAAPCPVLTVRVRT